MLDIKFIREQAETVRRGAADKRIKFDLDRLLELDAAIRPLQMQCETLQSERNSLSKTIGQSQPAEREALKARVSEIKAQYEALDAELKTKKAELDELMLLVPQPARADVPVGRDDSENVEIKRWGTPRTFSFEPKGHMALGEALNLIDVPRGVKLAGSRSYVLRGDGARLEQAVLRFTFDYKRVIVQLSLIFEIKSGIKRFMLENNKKKCGCFYFDVIILIKNSW